MVRRAYRRATELNKMIGVKFSPRVLSLLLISLGHGPITTCSQGSFDISITGPLASSSVIIE